MRTRVFQGVLVALNLLLIGTLLVENRVRAMVPEPPVLRANSLELTDSSGRVRAYIGTEADGEVVLRLTGQNGEIRVKLGASSSGSGLFLANDAAEAGLQAMSNPDGTQIILKDRNGQQILEP
jgi:hypothetical protein